MKNWDSLFGEVPESFSRRVHDTVDRLERQESAPRPAFRLRPVAVLALALCLLAGTAAALSGLGVLDTLGRELRAYLQPEAKELVQTSVFQAASQPRHASFTVEEAVHDGRQMYLSVRVHPESDALLMDFNAEASWSRSWPEHPAQSDDGSETFAQAAAVQGKELVRADCEPVDENGTLLDRAVEVHYDGDDLLYNLSFASESGKASLRLFTDEVYNDDWNESRSFGTLELQVNVTERGKVYTADTPVVSADGQLAVTGLTVVQSPIATYVTYEYAAAENAAMKTRVRLYNHRIWVRWLDENGEPVPESILSQGLSGDDEHTAYTCTYRAFETLPQTMRLEFYQPGGGDTTQISLPLREATENRQ